MKILYVHHVRELHNENVYLNDDYDEANLALYGAQEMDTWAGVRMLSNDHQVYRLEICINSNRARLLDPSQRTLREFDISHKSIDVNYIKTLLKYLDPSIAQFAYKSFKSLFQNIFENYSFDVWWVDTQFYAGVIPREIKSITRSVNFEPFHVLGEDQSPYRFIKSILKIWSEVLVSRHTVFMSISPLDSRRYSRLGLKQIPYLPLRQLIYLPSKQNEEIQKGKYFCFAGSTYDVRHNYRNLLFIVNVLAPRLAVQLPEYNILIFGNRLPKQMKLPTNVKYMGFSKDLHEFLIHSTAVVIPYSGGAGMQSKLFVPLKLGALVIANPKNFAGYEFVQNIHYLAATNPDEFVKQIIRSANKPVEEMLEIGINARIKSDELFKVSEFTKIINQAFLTALDN
ncbi:MAG: glycosyltransferase [Bacteroidetes bacterium]|nr:glycosyltransferase [bacterium]NBP64860.1 glycosyltransferase [Bacteroidota bacterium]